MGIGTLITYLAVVSWCASAYMLPVIAIYVWDRRRKDKTEIIQKDDWIEGETNE